MLVQSPRASLNISEAERSTSDVPLDVFVIDHHAAILKNARFHAVERVNSKLRGENEDGTNQGRISRLIQKARYQLGEEYFRQRETAAELGKLQSEIAAPTENKFVKNTIIANTERFKESLISERERKSIHVISSKCQTYRTLEKLIARYTESDAGLSEEEFRRSAKEIIDEYIDRNKLTLHKDSISDNMLDVANTLKNNGVTYRVDSKSLNIQLGVAESAVAEEGEFTRGDRIVQWAERTGFSWAVNPTTVGLATAVGVYAASRGATLVGRVAGAIGGGAFAGGLVSAFRKGTQLRRDRSHAALGAAYGNEAGEEGTNLSTARSFVQQLKSSNELMWELRSHNQDTAFSAIAFTEEALALRSASVIVGKADLSKRDFISWDGEHSSELSRLHLLRELAQAKVRLAKELGGSSAELDTLLDKGRADIRLQINNHVLDIEKGFDRHRRAERIRALLVGYVSGVGIGAVAFGLRHLQLNLTQGSPLTKWMQDLSHRYLGKQIPFFASTPSPVMTEAMNSATGRGENIFKLPEGYRFVEGGTKIIDPTGKDVANGLTYSSANHLTDDSIEKLRAQGWEVKQDISKTVIPGKSELKSIGIKEYVDSSPSLRKVADIEGRVFRNYGTLRADHNELKLRWGGSGGVSSDGENYVLSVKGMSQYRHVGSRLDVPGLMRGGKLKALLSLGTDMQNTPVELDVNSKGEIIIPRNSELGRIAFRQEGEGVKYLGKYLEVVSESRSSVGARRFEVLATHSGAGIERVDVETTTPSITTEIYTLEASPRRSPPWLIGDFSLPIVLSRRNALESHRNVINLYPKDRLVPTYSVDYVLPPNLPGPVPLIPVFTPLQNTSRSDALSEALESIWQDPSLQSPAAERLYWLEPLETNYSFCFLEDDQTSKNCPPVNGIQTNVGEMVVSLEPAEYRRTGGGRNEDAVFVGRAADDGVRIAVADGMGGRGGGEIASKTAAKALEQGFRGGITLAESLDLIPGMLEEEFQKVAGDGPDAANHLSRMGTTIAAVEIKENKLYPYNLGDSKIMVIRDGKIVFESIDHSDLQEAVIKGEITAEERLKSPWNNIINGAYRRTELMTEGVRDYPPVDLEEGDFVILASNGLFDNYTPQQIADVSKLAKSVEELNQTLRQGVALQRLKKKNGESDIGKDDDLAIVVLKYKI